MYRDRDDAARALARELRRWQGAHPLVVGIPRGAAPMAATIARELGGEVDVVLVRKLRAPFNPEFAVGSVDEAGWTYVAPHADAAGADAAHLAQETRAQLATDKVPPRTGKPMRPPEVAPELHRSTLERSSPSMHRRPPCSPELRSSSRP